jgi:Trk K+ transport system NAD-binding subunit
MRPDNDRLPTERKVTLKQRLDYHFENTLSKGLIPIIVWLSILTLMVVVFFGVVLVLTGLNSNNGSQFTPLEAFWQSFLHTIDTGAIQADTTWGYRIIATILTLMGVFIFSALISVLTTGLDGIFVQIRKGRSKVIEKNYTLILGWTNKIFKIVSELIVANANQKHRHIVIMADRDKISMEDELRSRIPDRKTTHIIVRRGNPLDLDDLKIVTPSEAKSIIILAPEEKNPDSYVIKSILALNHMIASQPPGVTQIIAELKDKSNIDAIEFWEKDAKVRNKCYIHSQDILARITALTSRQSGYSAILTELLDYEYSEIYFKPIPQEFIGKPFYNSLFSKNRVSSVSLHKNKDIIENITVIGIRRGKETLINPLIGEEIKTLQKDDQLIVVAEDDYEGTLEMIDNPNVDERAIANIPHSQDKTENVLILGWNENCKTIITELSNYIETGSEILVIADKIESKDHVEQIRQGKEILIKYREADTTDHRVLEKLELGRFDYIIVLGYTNLDIQERDARTLLTLLHLRKILENRKVEREISIVSELSDDRNRRLAETFKPCDFIISDNIISTMMAQLSENSELKPVFDDLMNAGGCEIYLRPVTNYINPKIEVNFNTIIKSAAQKKEIAIGYRKIAEADKPNHYGVYLNPVKSEIVKFENDDKVIVISEG